MKKFFLIFLFVISFALNSDAKQILPDIIKNNTISITAPKTRELGKNYFYCANGVKCSTEQIIKEYYKNNGYKVMRAEYSFWKGMFTLTFLDELYPESKTFSKLFDIPVANISSCDVQKKYKYIQKANLQKFINNQIYKHEQGSYIRWLNEWEIEGYKNPTEYFKTSIVQEFLSKIDNKTFQKVIKHIVESKEHNPIGTPDYIVWNDNKMIFVEVKRKNERLSPEQLEWGKYLIQNKISYKIIRVEPE